MEEVDDVDVLYTLFAYTALAQADLVPALVSDGFTEVAIWVLTAYFTLDAIMKRDLTQQTRTPCHDPDRAGSRRPVRRPCAALTVRWLHGR